MNMQNKVTVLQNMILSVFFGIIFTLIAQVVYESRIHFDWYGFWLPIIFGTVIGYLIIAALPIAQLGVALAFLLKAKPGSFLFRVVVSFVIATFFVPIMTIVMGIFSGVIIPSIKYDFQHIAPVMEIIKGAIAFKGIPLFFIIAFPIALCISKPSEMLAKVICKT